MMSYFIHLLVVIHQEFGNLGIQNRKGLSFNVASIGVWNLAFKIGRDLA